MRNPRTCRSLVLTAAVLLCLVGSSCSDDGDKAVDTEDTQADVDAPTTGTSTDTTGTAPAPAEGDQAVSIANYEFDPDAITVEVGTTVSWTNTDDFAHTATSKEGAPAAFDTGELVTDASGTHTFELPGTYAYQCDIHTYMAGTVEVVG